MKILVSCLAMSYLSGSPLYNYELCLELKRRGHDVTVISEFQDNIRGEEGHYLQENLKEAGVKLVPIKNPNLLEPNYDLIFCSQNSSLSVIQRFGDTPAVNIVHSEYEYETPIPDSPQMIGYICIRHNILNHIVTQHNIPVNKCVVIYNGIDRKRFSKKKVKPRDFYRVVVPCTLDTMREQFLNKMIAGATEDRRVDIYGFDCNAKLNVSPFARVFKDKFHIEEEMQNCDEVAGILLGRVNLEAWSCGVNSSVYDPNTLEGKVFAPPVDFDDNYNIVKVVDKMLILAGNLDDITVIIPHHTARPQLARLLENIKEMRYISVIKGGSFARNNNVGVETAKTEYVLITNDDTTFNAKVLLRNMMNAMKDVDIVGATPDRGVKGFTINPDTKQLEVVEGGKYPSGALLLMRTSFYREMKGFDEIFINGGEDIDLYLRAEALGYKVKRIDDVYHHDECQSVGRFDYCSENEIIFNKRWLDVCHIGIPISE